LHRRDRHCLTAGFLLDFFEGLAAALPRPLAERIEQLLEEDAGEHLLVEELREAIDDFRAKNPDANVGTIMAHLKTSFGGQYDGKAASALARG